MDSVEKVVSEMRQTCEAEGQSDTDMTRWADRLEALTAAPPSHDIEEQARKARREAVEALGSVAREAVEHVSYANYASREAEAKEWIAKAISDLMDSDTRMNETNGLTEEEERTLINAIMKSDTRRDGE